MQPNMVEHDLGFDPDTSSQEIESVTDYHHSLRHEHERMIREGMTESPEFHQLDKDLQRLEEEMERKQI